MSDNPTNLSTHHCVPCEGGVAPLKREEFAVYLEQVKDWNVIDDKALQREFIFKNFKETVAFINKVAEVAESEGHHPDLNLHNYKKLTVHLYTHAIGGLSTNDFIMAVKIDELFNQK
jgi:4a-hydroxytetrahydrobiopterin dehydratase